MYWYPRYVPVGLRRARALVKMRELREQGMKVQPVELRGRTIAGSFWGRRWCEHLESFSDYANRLPLGRTYLRNGSVCHLAIGAGRVEAMVAGQEIYRVVVRVRRLERPAWEAIRTACAGRIGSVIELLQGRLPDRVMDVFTHRDTGLFPRTGRDRPDVRLPGRGRGVPARRGGDLRRRQPSRRQPGAALPPARGRRGRADCRRHAAAARYGDRGRPRRRAGRWWLRRRSGHGGRHAGAAVAAAWGGRCGGTAAARAASGGGRRDGAARGGAPGGGRHRDGTARGGAAACGGHGGGSEAAVAAARVKHRVGAGAAVGVARGRERGGSQAVVAAARDRERDGTADVGAAACGKERGGSEAVGAACDHHRRRTSAVGAAASGWPRGGTDDAGDVDGGTEPSITECRPAGHASRCRCRCRRSTGSRPSITGERRPAGRAPAPGGRCRRSSRSSITGEPRPAVRARTPGWGGGGVRCPPDGGAGRGVARAGWVLGRRVRRPASGLGGDRCAVGRRQRDRSACTPGRRRP